MVFLAIFIKVNMQIEGFLFQMFSLFFGGAFIHYSIAKIFGPVYFGRGFCGWACWNAMIFDLLPWKKTGGGYSI
jgi:ferredoxin-type protein NapH